MAAENRSDDRADQLHPWRVVWVGYWLVVWTTTALFLLAASTSNGNLGALGFTFPIALVWTLVGWPADILMLLFTPGDRSSRFPLVANCLLATIGRAWSFHILGPILAAY